MRESGDEHDEQQRQHWRTVLVVVAVGLAVVAVLLSQRSTKPPELFGVDPDDIEPQGHFTVGFVLALVASTLLWGRRWGRRPAVALGFLTSAVVTTVLELAQFWSSTRSTGVEDGLLNIAGAAAGATAAAVLFWALGRRTLPAVTVLAALALVAGVVVLNLDGPLGRSCEYEQLPVESEAAPDPLDQSSVWVWDLSGAATSPISVPAQESGLPLLASTGTAPTVGVGGVVFTEEDGGLTSGAAGEAISAAVRSQQSFVFEVRAAPTSTSGGLDVITMLGPGRSASDSNLMVGRDGADLTIWLRLGCGHYNPTTVRDVFDAGVERSVVIRFAEARQEVWVDGAMVDRRRYLDEFSSTISWDLAAPLFVGTDGQLQRPFAGVVSWLGFASTR